MNNRYSRIIQQLGGKTGFTVPVLLDVSPWGEKVATVESYAGQPLPSDYREFLRDNDGFSFIGGVGFDFKIKTDRDGGTVSTFYDVDTLIWLLAVGREEFRKSGETYPIDLIPGIRLVRHIEDGITEIGWPDELLPIACDPGGNQICLAVAGLRYGAVFFWINAAGFGDQNVYLIADSFDEFMQVLRANE